MNGTARHVVTHRSHSTTAIRRAVSKLAVATLVMLGMLGLSLVPGAPTTSAQTAVDWGDIDTSGLEVVPGTIDTTISLNFWLGLTADHQGREAFARAVSDPASPEYGRYSTVAELADRFGASDAVTNSVVDYFSQQGLVATIDPTATNARVTMTIAQAQTIFSSTWGMFTYPASNFYNGAVFLYPTSTPVLPAEIAGSVERVSGAVALDLGATESNSESSSEMLAQLAELADRPGTSSGGSTVMAAATAIPDSYKGAGGTAVATGTPQGCAGATGIYDGPYRLGLTPNQVLDAYEIEELHNSGFRGEGMRVAIVDDSVYDPTWLSTYRDCFGLNAATPVIDHVIGTPSQSESTETILDLSVMSAVAPMVERFDVFMVDTPTDPNILDLPGELMAMLVEPLDAAATGGEAPDVISASFAACEASPLYWEGKSSAVDILEASLSTAVGAGIGYVVSAGDDGASGCDSNLAEMGDPTNPAVTVQSASYPSTSAWVTQVGGTNLTLAEDNSIVSSGAWNVNQYPAYDNLGTNGGGGGPSTMVKRPWYQDFGGVAATPWRSGPDIASFADQNPGYTLFGPTDTDPAWFKVGGTSASAPLNGGLLLLLGQQAESRNQPHIGFANPLLYRLGAAGGTGLLDITLGNIDVFGVTDCCPAGPGFDLATGWGSPMAAELSAALANPDLTLEASVGGTTFPTTVTYRAAAVAPVGSVTSYRWDIDVDGTIDTTTTTPELVLPAAGPSVQNVAVAATTDFGRTSVAGVSVDLFEIRPTPARATGAPAALAFVG